MLLNKLIAYLGFLSTLLFFELIVIMPGLWFILPVLAALIIFLLILKLFNWQFRQKEFYIFLSTTLILIISTFLFVFFMDSPSIRLATIIIISILIGFYLNNIFLFLYSPQSYPPYSLENITTYFNMVSFFFLMSSFFSLAILLGISILLLLIPTFVITVVLTLLTQMVNKVDLAKTRFFLSILSLTMVELFWAIHYLPTNFFINGVVLTIIYYMFMVLGLDYLTGKIEKTVVKRTLLIGCFMIILILVFAQWT